MWMWSLSNILLYKFNAFSILTKHLLCTVAVTFAVWGAAAKPAWISYPFFTVSRIEDQHMIFFSFLIQECLPFYLKEALYSFSLADLNCQHHYSCASGPLLSKIRVIECKHWDPMTVDLIVDMATKWLMSGILWTKGWFTSRVGGNRTLWDFIMQFRLARKWIVYFWNFPFNIFGPELTAGSWNWGNRNLG